MILAWASPFKLFRYLKKDITNNHNTWGSLCQDLNWLDNKSRGNRNRKTRKKKKNLNMFGHSPNIISRYNTNILFSPGVRGTYHATPPPHPKSSATNFLSSWRCPEVDESLHKLGPAQILSPISTAISEKTIYVDISVNISDNCANKVSRPMFCWSQILIKPFLKW